jgi:hypothetical protein
MTIVVVGLSPLAEKSIVIQAGSLGSTHTWLVALYVIAPVTASGRQR